MTKQDMEALTIGGVLGGAIFGWFYFLKRKRLEIPVLNPTQIKWANQ